MRRNHLSHHPSPTSTDKCLISHRCRMIITSTEDLAAGRAVSRDTMAGVNHRCCPRETWTVRLLPRSMVAQIKVVAVSISTEGPACRPALPWGPLSRVWHYPLATAVVSKTIVVVSVACLNYQIRLIDWARAKGSSSTLRPKTTEAQVRTTIVKIITRSARRNEAYKLLITMVEVSTSGRQVAASPPKTSSWTRTTESAAEAMLLASASILRCKIILHPAASAPPADLTPSCASIRTVVKCSTRWWARQ